jgi:alkylation response protein AidB-like acyl-CoA dehydrogenase
MASLAPSLVRELVGDDPDASGMDLARDCMANVPEASYRAMMLALVGFNQRDALKNIAVPTLLLSGSKDNNAPAPMMAKMAGYIPSAHYVELAGVGHLANLERPGAFNEALAGFLKSVGESTGNRAMTVQVSKGMNTTGKVALDAPIFDPVAFRLSEEQAAIISRAREIGQTVFAGRASAHDRDATFPTENYRDLHRAGLLGIAVPKRHGGLGAGYQTYALAAAEIGRYCGATALTWNMHVCSTLWSGPLADDLDMDATTRAEHERRRAIHYKRIVEDGAIYSQPFSEGGAAAAGGVAFGTEAKPVAGGWIVNGKKIFASLSGHADYYGVLCTEIEEGEKASRRNTLYLAIAAKTEGVSVVGDWDPLGMRGTVSRTLLFKDVFVPEEGALMPRGVYFQAASRWPHMFLTLSPTYMGLAQASYDFTVRYLRGEVPGMPPVKRRMYPTKQIAVAQMQITLEQIKAIWFQTVTEARSNPSKEQVLRAYAAQYSVMEGANELAALAIRTCGGQAMLKSLPLERIYRDSRCGSLMLPWTAELCLDRIGRDALYEAGESDD